MPSLFARPESTLTRTPAPARHPGIFVANMCHISPFAATMGLVSEGSKLLAPGGFLAIYGPFKDEDDRFTTESNRAFDERLRSQDKTWGYRSVAQLDALCAEAGLQLVSRRDMPANNYFLTYIKVITCK